MRIEDFTKNIIEDIRVDISDEFDLNFKKESFFGKPWKKSKSPKTLNRRGNSGLRGSINGKTDNNEIIWSSSLPYASIHNEGGEIVVTDKMKSFFWAMAYKAGMASGKGSSERNKRLTAEAQQWRNLALQKVGSKMKIEQRQFIGDHPIVRQRIEDIVDKNIKELQDHIYNQLKK